MDSSIYFKQPPFQIFKQLAIQFIFMKYLLRSFLNVFTLPLIEGFIDQL